MDGLALLVGLTAEGQDLAHEVSGAFPGVEDFH